MKFLTPLLSLFLIWQLALSPVWAQVPAAAADLQIRLVEGDDLSIVNTRSDKGFTIELTGKGGTPVADAAVLFRLPDSGATGAFADGSHAFVAYTDANGRASAKGIQWSGTPGSATLKITAAKGTEHAGLRVERNLTRLVDSTQPLPSALAAAGPAVAAQLPQAAGPEAKPGTPATPNDSLGPKVAQAAADTKPQTPGDVPAVTITNSSSGGASHSGSAKKWVIIAAVVAGVGVGAAVALKGMGGHGGATTASSLSIGSPTISVGH